MFRPEGWNGARREVPGGYGARCGASRGLDHPDVLVGAQPRRRGLVVHDFEVTQKVSSHVGRAVEGHIWPRTFEHLSAVYKLSLIVLRSLLWKQEARSFAITIDCHDYQTARSYDADVFC